MRIKFFLVTSLLVASCSSFAFDVSDIATCDISQQSISIPDWAIGTFIEITKDKNLNIKVEHDGIRQVNGVRASDMKIYFANQRELAEVSCLKQEILSIDEVNQKITIQMTLLSLGPKADILGFSQHHLKTKLSIDMKKNKATGRISFAHMTYLLGFLPEGSTSSHKAIMAMED